MKIKQMLSEGLVIRQKLTKFCYPRLPPSLLGLSLSVDEIYEQNGKIIIHNDFDDVIVLERREALALYLLEVQERHNFTIEELEEHMMNMEIML